MKQTLLAVAFAAIAVGALADERESCARDYLAGDEETLRGIVERAYVAPTLKIVLARNPGIGEPDDALAPGALVHLPCLHGLPQYAPVFPEEFRAAARAEE
ncbi:MAG: hypothetical protein D6773_14715 [Alphaproteobacteria bacterium]|nr:MAG: hypothetical protein D6773_14715 [Alphaproteobacteria bacterium]